METFLSLSLLAGILGARLEAFAGCSLPPKPYNAYSYTKNADPNSGQYCKTWTDFYYAVKNMNQTQYAAATQNLTWNPYTVSFPGGSSGKDPKHGTTSLDTGVRPVSGAPIPHEHWRYSSLSGHM
jgi:hypothetical protein